MARIDVRTGRSGSTAQSTALALLGALALGLSAGSPAVVAQDQENDQQSDQQGDTQLAAIVRLDGEIDELTERTLEMRVARALAMNPRFLIISIESPGGGYEASRSIAWNLKELQKQRTDIHVAAFIRGNALSGATIVAFGCEFIAVSPSAQLGDSMPIYTGALAPKVAEKFISPVRKDLEQLAMESGYPIDVAGAMVDPGVELHRIEVRGEGGRVRPRWISRAALEEESQSFRAALISDTIVCPSGELLVLSSTDAMEIGIARMEADDEAALCEALAQEFSIDRVTPVQVNDLWWSSAVRFVTWWPVKVLLFVVGVVALLAALAQPGTGAPEALFVACFAAVFFGSYLIGLADWVELILVLAGLGLLAVEIFITPGFGVMGSLGALSLAAALLLSFQRFVIPESDFQWDLLGANLAKTAAGCTLSLVGIGLALRFLPKSRLFKGLVHDHTQAAVPATTPGQEQAPVGTICVAETSLRPVGKVKVGAKVLEAVAEHGMLDAGATVVVVGYRGNELVVSGRPEAIDEAKNTKAQASDKAASEPAPEPEEESA